MSCQFIIMITKKSAKDEAWLVHVANAPKQSASADGDVITWAGYNSLLANDVSVKPPAVTGVYPLFPDKAASASSMKHAMELPMHGTEFLNPGKEYIVTKNDNFLSFP